MKRKYWHQLLIAIDQLFNALFAGWADETISSRAYRCRDKWRWRITMRVINVIFFWQDNHCKEAYLFELEQGHKPQDFYNDYR